MWAAIFMQDSKYSIFHDQEQSNEYIKNEKKASVIILTLLFKVNSNHGIFWNTKDYER